MNIIVREIIQNEPFLLLGIAIVMGFYMGNVARRFRLPSLVGFLVLGVLLGPSVLNLFCENNLHQLSFITELALSFVALSIGAELSLRSLRQLGNGIIFILLAESFGAFIVVTLAVYVLTRNWPMAILLGAVAPASAPAGTVAVIQEYRAQGNLTKALYAVVGFDDGLAIVIFAFAAAMAKSILMAELNVVSSSDGLLAAMKLPVIEIVGSLVLGAILGFVYTRLVQRLRTARDMLILTFGIVFVTTGISTHLHLSLILTNMVVGFVLANTRREAFVHRVTTPLQEIMPLLFLMFFCVAGAHLSIKDLPSLGIVGIVYIVARSAGKIGGASLAATIGKVEEKVKKYIGLGILSQAGVAIGLTLIVRDEFVLLAGKPEVASALQAYAAHHPDVPRIVFDPLSMSAALLTTITATCIVFEIIGPILTKLALQKAGEIPEQAL